MRHQLQQKSQKIIDNNLKMVEGLSRVRQALWSMLCLSIMSRFEYFCHLGLPSLSEPVAGMPDSNLWTVLEAAVGYTVHRGENGTTVNCLVAQLQGQSYQEWAMRLPIRFHGWGLRSLAETCGLVYLGALETAIPYMAARDKLCPAREVEWGGDECWGKAADPRHRWSWRVLLQSG